MIDDEQTRRNGSPPSSRSSVGRRSPGRGIPPRRRHVTRPPWPGAATRLAPSSGPSTASASSAAPSPGESRRRARDITTTSGGGRSPGPLDSSDRPQRTTTAGKRKRALRFHARDARVHRRTAMLPCCCGRARRKQHRRTSHSVWTRRVAVCHAVATSTTVRDAIPEKSSTFSVKTGSSFATAVAAISAS